MILPLNLALSLRSHSSECETLCVPRTLVLSGAKRVTVRAAATHQVRAAPRAARRTGRSRREPSEAGPAGSYSLGCVYRRAGEAEKLHSFLLCVCVIVWIAFWFDRHQTLLRRTALLQAATDIAQAAGG